MDTLEKQKERHYLLEKRQKIRKRFFPLRVALVAMIFVGAIYGIKNHTFFEGWMPQLVMVIIIGLVITYLIEALIGGYKK